MITPYPLRFRGMTINSDTWLYGNILMPERETDSPKMWDAYGRQYQVYRESVGQYTLYKDAEGIEIYSGDVIRLQKQMLLYVCFEKGCFALRHYKGLKDADGGDMMWGPMFRAWDMHYRIDVIGPMFQLKNTTIQ